MGIENPVHLLFLGAVALLVLGPKRLPELAKALGNGIREFRESISDGEDGEKTASSNGSPPVDASAAVQAAAAAVAPTAPPASQAPTPAPPAPAPSASAPPVDAPTPPVDAPPAADAQPTTDAAPAADAQPTADAPVQPPPSTEATTPGDQQTPS